MLVRIITAGVALLAVTSHAAAQDAMIVVPLEISGLPPTVQAADISCLIDNEADGDFGRVWGRGSTIVPLINGGYSGQVRIQIRPGAYPPGVDPIPDVRRYRCDMDFRYTCNSPTGGLTQCTFYPGASGEDSPARSLFNRAEGEPYRVGFDEVIDPAGAEDLPRRFR